MKAFDLKELNREIKRGFKSNSILKNLDGFLPLFLEKQEDLLILILSLLNKKGLETPEKLEENINLVTVVSARVDENKKVLPSVGYTILISEDLRLYCIIKMNLTTLSSGNCLNLNLNFRLETKAGFKNWVRCWSFKETDAKIVFKNRARREASIEDVLDCFEKDFLEF